MAVWNIIFSILTLLVALATLIVSYKAYKYAREATIKQIELEIERTRMLADQAKQEWEGVQRIKNGGLSHMADWRNSMMKSYQEDKPERDFHIYANHIDDLNVIKRRLMANKKEFGGD